MLLPIVSAVALLANGVSSSTTVLEKRQIPTDECEAHLLIDDFSKWTTGLNTLSGATSDDATLTAINATDDKLTFVPGNLNVSYIYEQFACIDADDLGYDSISFTIKGPEAASVSLELQAQEDCESTTYQSYYYTINGLTGTLQTVNIPLTDWANASLDGLVGFVWYGFSAGRTGTDDIWELDNFQLLCEGIDPPGDPTTTTKATLTRTATHTKRVPDSFHEHKRYEKQAIALREAAAAAAAAHGKRADNATCELALIDDWESQSRLTFLYYNALLKPASDDLTMKSVVVANNKVTLTPTDTDSYFYSQLGCFDARDYGGISLRITAAKGTTFDVQLSSSNDDKCDEENTTDVTVSSKSLGWTFDGTEKLYSIPFTKYSGLDYSRFGQIILSGLSKPITLGPVALYCGKTVAEYVAPPVKEPAEPTGTVAAPTATAKTLVIDTFASKETNALGQWHGTEDDGLTITYSKNTVTLQTNDSDLSYVTQVSPTCLDMTQYDGAYLHLAYSGSSKFTISLQQHNAKCDNDAQPYPETWDSLEAARYATDKDIYIPLDHFAVNRSRVVGLAIKGLYTLNPTTISKIEVVDSVPASFKVPVKLPTGSFIFACTRPNSFAFAIDDGDPQYAQYVMSVIEEAGFKATFFTVGAPLLDPSTNLSNVYLDMKARGHQIALHSYTHPPLEGLPDEASIDWEYTNDLAAVDQIFGAGQVTKYFRPPFGNEGARMRQRYAALVPDPYIMQWSVDVEDWLWAETDTPEKQIDSFKRDVAAGGSITVMHYLYNSTVSYLPQFIEVAKATGKQLMRIDQCMEDPNAPPL